MRFYPMRHELNNFLWPGIEQCAIFQQRIRYHLECDIDLAHVALPPWLRSRTNRIWTDI